MLFLSIFTVWGIIWLNFQRTQELIKYRLCAMITARIELLKAYNEKYYYD